MLRLIASTVIGCALLAYACTVADARPKQTHTDSGKASQCIYDNTARIVCPGPVGRSTGRHRVSAAYENDAQIVAHPAGCPRRLFCGCGVSVKVFGKPVRDLYLAANWLYRFPRTAPASGMVAARRGHVMYIMAYNGGGSALVYDPNSGGGKTRIHERSLAGYRVVDPNGVRVAGR